MKNKVFLGGTCSNTTCRDELIPMLKADYFNPVVSDWTPECQAEEERQKSDECNIHLYVITPSMEGYFSIAEIIESAHMADKTTIVYIQEEEIVSNAKLGIKTPGIHHINTFTRKQKYSLDAVCELAKKHGAKICYSLKHVAKVINEMEETK